MSGEAETPAVEDRYNPIFETFIGKDAADENDLTNLVAYSLYRRRTCSGRCDSSPRKSEIQRKKS